jgi:hypothetical protein
MTAATASTISGLLVRVAVAAVAFFMAVGEVVGTAGSLDASAVPSKLKCGWRHH